MEPIEVNKGHLRRVSVKRGDLIRGVSASSKCDRLNVEWSKQHQWFKYDPDDPRKFRSRLGDVRATLDFGLCVVPWRALERWTQKTDFSGLTPMANPMRDGTILNLKYTRISCPEHLR